METHRHITHTVTHTTHTHTYTWSHTQTYHSHTYIHRHAVTHTHTTAGITGTYHHIWPFYVVLGMELRSSCLCDWHSTTTHGSAWDHDFTVVKGPHGQKEAFRLRIFACPPSFPHGLQAVVFGFLLQRKKFTVPESQVPWKPS